MFVDKMKHFCHNILNMYLTLTPFYFSVNYLVLRNFLQFVYMLERRKNLTFSCTFKIEINLNCALLSIVCAFSFSAI